jgi:hypothetical protein
VSDFRSDLRSGPQVKVRQRLKWNVRSLNRLRLCDKISVSDISCLGADAAGQRCFVPLFYMCHVSQLTFSAIEMFRHAKHFSALSDATHCAPSCDCYIEFSGLHDARLPFALKRKLSQGM